MSSNIKHIDWNKLKDAFVEDPKKILDFISNYAKEDCKFFLTYYILHLRVYIRGYWTYELFSIGLAKVTLELVTLVFLTLFSICYGIYKREEIKTFVENLDWEEMIDIKTNNKYSYSKMYLIKLSEKIRVLCSHYILNKKVPLPKTRKTLNRFQISYDDDRNVDSRMPHIVRHDTFE